MNKNVFSDFKSTLQFWCPALCLTLKFNSVSRLSILKWLWKMFKYIVMILALLMKLLILINSWLMELKNVVFLILVRHSSL